MPRLTVAVPTLSVSAAIAVVTGACALSYDTAALFFNALTSFSPGFRFAILAATMARWLAVRCRRHRHLTTLDGFDRVLITVLEDTLGASEGGGAYI